MPAADDSRVRDLFDAAYLMRIDGSRGSDPGMVKHSGHDASAATAAQPHVLPMASTSFDSGEPVWSPGEPASADGRLRPEQAAAHPDDDLPPRSFGPLLIAVLMVCLLGVCVVAFLHRPQPLAPLSVNITATGSLHPPQPTFDYLRQRRPRGTAPAGSDVVLRLNADTPVELVRPSTSRSPLHTAATAAAAVNLNRATAAELDALPGIGPVLAQRIIEWRTRNNGFSQVQELREVEGIGLAKFARLRDSVGVW